jgi:hypothetical protein
MEFSDIAFAKFLQTAPELSNLILTFKDVTEELTNESDIQVGLFVLRSGDDILYVPVVSKGDGIYPIDSIFVSSKNKFFPLTKNTVEKILNSQKLSLGQAKKMPESVPTNPSVQHLVNPPRTGKFVYASASRLTDFLSSIPTSLKEQILEKFASDSDVYNGLHKLFDIKSLFMALKSRTLEKADQPADRSVGVIITSGTDLPNPQVASILTDGYAINGSNPLTRVAIASEDWKEKRFQGLSTLEAGFDYDVVMRDGTVRKAYIPVRKEIQTNDKPREAADPQFILFEDGSYALNRGAVTVGEKGEPGNVIRSIFGFKPPIVLKNVNSGDTIAIFGDSLDLIGVYDVRKIAITHNGCTIDARDLIAASSCTIQGIRGFSRPPVGTDDEIFVAMSSIVMVLGQRQADLESSVNAAARRREMIEWALLNTQMSLTHDGVEYSINGKPMGKEAQVMEVLVSKEGIDPIVAQNFVKQAKQKKRLTVYLSKKADFEPGEIPQFGNQPPKQINQLGTQQDYLPMPKLQAGLSTQDPQTVESIVISELLQAPDMNEYVVEYLPDIEEAIDRLGRILFLGRLHINKLGEGNEADKVFELLTSLKNVYKMLGDNYIKLEQLSSSVGTPPTK